MLINFSDLIIGGREGLNHLVNELAETGGDVAKKYLMVISDIEMPEIDGYAFTRACREHPGLQKFVYYAEHFDYRSL
ncbi:response regulator [Piscirickettsia litoralis]|uniref:Response regulatory domain-containing protein n=1 Tax=Piscirickettsia litoralis TaxID=1891921 RepID=A0ABX3A2B9_9GAMM|nr:response regulator [Piscirickettsia litoralis]ODN41590.1 hypothetical protein BGC07_15940 [Piscirickettsia litoralis]